MGACLQALTDETLREAAQVVRAGGLIAFPTETFYGLGVMPFDDQAVHRVFDLKGRAVTSPILVLISARSQLKHLVAEVTPTAELLMEACWPGPLTLVLQAASHVPHVLTAGTGTIGVRLSASTTVRRLLGILEGPLTGTSANRSGDTPATTAREVQDMFGSEVDLILDGGPSPGGLPSTVVDTTVMPARLLRQGVLSKDRLLSVIGTLAA